MTCVGTCVGGHRSMHEQHYTPKHHYLGAACAHNIIIIIISQSLTIIMYASARAWVRSGIDIRELAKKTTCTVMYGNCSTSVAENLPYYYGKAELAIVGNLIMASCHKHPARIKVIPAYCIRSMLATIPVHTCTVITGGTCRQHCIRNYCTSPFLLVAD